MVSLLEKPAKSALPILPMLESAEVSGTELTRLLLGTLTLADQEDLPYAPHTRHTPSCSEAVGVKMRPVTSLRGV